MPADVFSLILPSLLPYRSCDRLADAGTDDAANIAKVTSAKIVIFME